MRSRLFSLATLLSFVAGFAFAQSTVFPKWPGFLFGIADSNGNQIGDQNPMSTVDAPNPATVTWTAVTCGTSSTPFGITGASYLSVHMPPGAVNTGFGWGSSPATMAAPSQVYAAGSPDIKWHGGTGSCIVATGTQVITVGTR
jgi:hypothetical protein